MYLTATIANGASQSDVVDLRGVTILGVFTPSAWTAANLSFLACNTSGGTFLDVYTGGVGGSASTEAVLTMTTSSYLGITGVLADTLAAIRFLKLRSGTTGTPVNQLADRTIYLACKGWGWYAQRQSEEGPYAT